MGIALVFASALGYGLLPIFVKQAYAAGVTPRELLLWRFILATALIWGLFPVWRRALEHPLRTLPAPDRRLTFGMGLLFAVVAALTLLTIAAIPATTYTVILHTYPALVVLIAFALGQAVHPLEWLGVALAFVGSLLTVGARFAVYQPLDLLLPIGMSVSYAIYLYLSERLTGHVPGLAFGALSMTTTTLGLLVLLPFGGLTAQYTPQSWSIIALIAVVSTVIPLITMFLGIARLGASNAAILSTVEPVITVVLAVLLLSEPFSLLQLVGMVTVLASILLLVATKRV